MEVKFFTLTFANEELEKLEKLKSLIGADYCESVIKAVFNKHIEEEIALFEFIEE